MTNYRTFLEGKRLLLRPSGLEVSPAAVHPLLFPFQRDLTAWSVRKGRAALFADTGLGKLKEGYWKTAQRNLEKAKGNATTMFDLLALEKAAVP